MKPNSAAGVEVKSSGAQNEASAERAETTKQHSSKIHRTQYPAIKSTEPRFQPLVFLWKVF